MITKGNEIQRKCKKTKTKEKKSYYGASNYPGGPKNPFVDEMATKPKSPKKPKK